MSGHRNLGIDDAAIKSARFSPPSTFTTSAPALSQNERHADGFPGVCLVRTKGHIRYQQGILDAAASGRL